MSATVRNLRIVSAKLLEQQDALFGPPVGQLEQLADMHMLDLGREAFYKDAISRQVFDWRQQYACISQCSSSPQAFNLAGAPFSKEEWERLEKEAGGMSAGFAQGDYLLDRIDTWLLESYSLNGICDAEAGDVVLDCGTYTGNTSLYFSQKVGSGGHVYGFEPLPPFFSRYAANMKGIDNVTPVCSAVSNTTGKHAFFEQGPSSSCFGSPGATPDYTASTVRLDDFAAKNKLARVDFIKMDVEGAEALALKGARDILRRHRPKLAISAYHKKLDVVALPWLIQSIAPGYTFVLRHFSDNLCETVLYGVPERCRAGYAALCAAHPAQPEDGTAPGIQEMAPLFQALARLNVQHMQSFVKGMQAAAQNKDALCALLHKQNLALENMSRRNAALLVENQRLKQRAA